MPIATWHNGVNVLLLKKNLNAAALPAKAGITIMERPIK